MGPGWTAREEVTIYRAGLRARPEIQPWTRDISPMRAAEENRLWAGSRWTVWSGCKQDAIVPAFARAHRIYHCRRGDA